MAGELASLPSGGQLLLNVARGRQCHGCHALHFLLRACAGCSEVFYCTRRCQKVGWTILGHKRTCARLRAFDGRKNSCAFLQLVTGTSGRDDNVAQS